MAQVQSVPSNPPERTAAHRAWDICGRARRMSELDLDLLLLALDHASAIGAAAIAADAPADVRPAPVRAARLFAALQVKLALAAPDPASLQRVEALLDRLPARWATTVRERLAARRRQRLSKRPRR